MNMNFINKGTDEAILKSLPTENVSEELVKAMNKQGLVQKEVQVKGKNGKVFTRKQWVKASDNTNKSNEKMRSSSDDKIVDKDFESYSLMWVNNGTHHRNFSSMSELKQELKNRGLPESLANFNIKKLDKDNGYVKTDYQNYSAYAYPRDTNLLNKPNTPQQPKKSATIPKELDEKLTHKGDPLTPVQSEYKGYKIVAAYAGISISKDGTEVLKTPSKSYAAEFLMKNTESSEEVKTTTSAKKNSKSEQPSTSDKKDVKASSGKSVGTVETVKDKSGATKVIATKPNGETKEFINSTDAKSKAENYLMREYDKERFGNTTNKSSASWLYKKDGTVSSRAKTYAEQMLSEIKTTGKIHTIEKQWAPYSRHQVTTDKTSKYTDILDHLGITYSEGNDAPRGGVAGKFLEVKNLKESVKIVSEFIKGSQASQSSASQKPPAKGYVMEIQSGGKYMYVYSEKSTKASAIEAYEKAGGKLTGTVTVVKRSNQVKLNSDIVKNKCVNIQNGEYGLPKVASSNEKSKTYHYHYYTASGIKYQSVKANSKQQAEKMAKLRHGLNTKIFVDTDDEEDEPSKTQSLQPSGKKLSKEDAKKKTQSFSSKVGKTAKERADFMNKVKANNITWKETENPSINWMRCLMAMNEHFANGGEFNLEKKSTSSSIPLKKDSADGETWYEGNISGHRVRILQETAGNSKYWNIEKDGEYIRTDNGRAMSFDNIEDAYEELKDSCNQNATNTTSTKSLQSSLDKEVSKGDNSKLIKNILKEFNYSLSAGDKYVSKINNIKTVGTIQDDGNFTAEVSYDVEVDTSYTDIDSDGVPYEVHDSDTETRTRKLTLNTKDLKL